MSDQSLRDALEKLANDVDSDDIALVNRRVTTKIRDLLAAHPVEPACQGDGVCTNPRCPKHGIEWTNAEPARPLLDREAVERAIATKVMYYDSATAVHEVDDGDLAGLTAGTDAVMELARPMPTQSELTEWLREIFTADPGGTPFGTAAEELLALLNGAES